MPNFIKHIKLTKKKKTFLKISDTIVLDEVSHTMES
jgi:hypothetical protein